MIVELINAEMHPNGCILATVDVTDDAGNTTRLSHFFPPDTMEWRVAEYDLDPVADADLILDIVLFEPHIEIPTDKMLYKTDRAAAKAALVDLVTQAKGKSEAAKAARRDARGAAAKAEADREAEARGKIRGFSVWHPEIVDVKREMVVKRYVEIQNAPPATDRITAALRKRQLSQPSGPQAVGPKAEEAQNG